MKSMAYVRAAMVLTVVFIFSLIGYMFFTFQSDIGVDLATEDFLKGQYQAALTELGKAEGHIPQESLLLYQAYLYRALKQAAASKQALEQAQFQAKKHENDDLLVEIYYNQAFNAYVANDQVTLNDTVNELKKIAPDNPWTTFFKALDLYQAGQFGAALDLWTKSEYPPRNALSRWMEKSFSEEFNHAWFAQHIAHSQIETGQYIAARQALEQELKTSPSNNDRDDFDFLLGWSYIKEAQDKPVSAAAPYFKLAMSYLSQVPIQSHRYDTERKALVAGIETLIQNLIAQGSYTDLPMYASILNSWDATSGLQEVSGQLVELLNQTFQEKNWKQLQELASLLNRVLPPGTTRTKLQNDLEKTAQESLQKGDLEQLTNVWTAAQILSDHPTELATSLADKASDIVLRTLPNDNATLQNTLPYIVFWKMAEKDPESQTAFANRLVGIAESLWLQQGHEAKGLKLMEVALDIPSGQQRFTVLQNVEQTLKKVYQNAAAKDDFDKMAYLLQAVKDLHLTNIPIQRDQNIAKLLSTAKEQLAAGNLQDARKRAKWVLELEPQNQTARRIVGKVYYLTANYPEAVKYLSLVSTPDLDTLESLAVAQILTGNSKEGQRLLDRVAQQHPLQQDNILRLGLGLIGLRQWENSLTWLQQLEKPSSEASVGTAFALFQLREFTKALEQIQAVKAPYTDLDSVKGIVLQSQLELGQRKAGEQALIALLKQPASADTSKFSYPFRLLQEQSLIELDRNYLAGLFFKKIKNQDDIAIRYFNLIQKPTPTMLVERADTLLQLVREREAILDLQAALKEADYPEVTQRAMPLIALAYARTGDDLHAEIWFQKFFTKFPQTTFYRGTYADVLRRLHRYDLALTQYRILDKAQSLSPEEAVGFVDSLIHTNQNQEAQRIAKRWMEKNPPISLDAALQIATLMVSTGNQEDSWGVLKRISNTSQLTSDQARALLGFLETIGAYAQAVSLVNELPNVFESSIRNLLAAAALNQHLSHNIEALDIAQKAYSLEPDNRDVIRFIGRYTRDEQQLAKLVTDLEHRVDQDPTNPTLRLLFAYETSRLARLVQNRNPQDFKRYSAVLHKARFYMEQTDRDFPNLPEVHYLLGETAALTNQTDKAAQEYQVALKLDPSYVDAYNALGELYQRSDRPQLALQTYIDAAKYSPTNGEIWQKLGLQFEKEGNLFEASSALQNAIKFRPNDIPSYIGLGRVFLNLRNPEDAKIILEHAAKITPKNETVQSLLLETLYDGVLQATTDDRKALIAQQQSVYKTLSEIDPAKAQRLLKRLQQQSSLLNTETDIFEEEDKNTAPPTRGRLKMEGLPQFPRMPKGF